MGNFQIGVADIVRTLRHRLERYDFDGGRTVLRELLQNADDARATKVSFCLFRREGISGARTSLLHGPAFVAINDGAFGTKHRDALTSFAQTSKEAETGAVGRFGIGQQSVFHICEAVCFVGSSESEGRIGGLLNPWDDLTLDEDRRARGDSDHPDWNQLSEEDINSIVAAVSTRLAGDSWFVLWAPLRRCDHLRGDGRAIPTTPLLEEPLLGALSLALGSDEPVRWMPQLGRVKQVSTLAAAAPPLANEHVLAAFDNVGGVHVGRFDQSATYRSPEPPVPSALRSTIAGNHIEHFVHLTERVLPDAVPDELLARLSGDARAKALPHGAVTVVRSPAGQTAELRLRWAVYLPVLEQPRPIPMVGARWSWTVTLHVNGFVDAGRRRLGGLDRADPRVSLASDPHDDWNRTVVDEVTLPGLMPALGGAVRGVSSAEIALLVRALREALRQLPSDLWSRGHVLLHPVGSDHWDLARRDGIQILSIPQPKTAASGFVSDLVRRFTRSSSGTRVVYDYNVLPASVVTAWTARNIAMLLASAAEFARASELIEYLCDWLEQHPDRTAVDAPLRRFAWRVAAACDFPADRNKTLGPAWKRLLGLIDADRVLFVTSDLRETVGPLAAANPESDVILLPRSVQPDSASDTPRFLLPDIAPLLRWLANQEPDSRREALQLKLLLSLDPNQLRALHRDPTMASLPCFVLHSVSTDALLRLTPIEVQGLVSEGRVFVLEGTHRPEQAIRALTDAVADPAFDVFAVKTQSEYERTAWRTALEIPPLSEEALLRPFIGPNPVRVVGDASKRATLLSRLLPQMSDQPSAEQLRAIHYLMHGRTEQGRAPGLWALSQDTESIRDVITRVLGAASLGWRLLPAELSRLDELTPRWRRALSISDLDAEVVANACGQVERGRLDQALAGANAAEREDLLVFLQDQDIAGQLPLLEVHDSHGVFVAAQDPRVYRAKEQRPPPELIDRVRVIRLAERTSVRTVQADIVREWGAKAQLEMALEAVDAHGASTALVELIIDSLRTAPVSDRARSVAWLPLASGQFVPPEQVLQLTPALETALRELPAELGFQARSAVPMDLNQGDLDKVLPSIGESFVVVCDGIGNASESVRARLNVAPFRDDVRVLADRVRRGDGSRPPEFGWVLLAEAPSEVLPRAIDVLTGPVAVKTWVGRLRWLAERQVPVPEYRIHLDTASRSPGFLDVLVQLELPCADGKWRRASQIAANGHGLAAPFRLHQQLEGIIKPRDSAFREQGETSTGPERGPPEEEVRVAYRTVREFFEPWVSEHGTSRAAVAAFVSLLGGADTSLADLVSEWMPDQRSCEQLQVDFYRVCRPRPGAEVLVTRERRLLGKTRTAVVRVDTGSSVWVETLGDDLVEAQVASGDEGNYELIVGELPTLRDGSRRVHLRVPPAGLAAEERTAAIEVAIRRILTENLFQQPTEMFDPFWRELADDGQHHVRIARRQAERDLPFVLDHLSCKGDEDLSLARNELRRALMRLDALQSEKQRGDLVDEAQAAVPQAQAKLIELIQQPAHASFVLERVRRRLRDYQYAARKVVFELLQNADDAILQLHGPRTNQIPGAARTAEVTLTRDDAPRLRVRHRGRPINDLGANAEEGRRRGYDLDLGNMLKLNASDKPDQPGATGRFGLGFKSVHLVTDRPRIQSGRMCFEIVGGVLPVQSQVDCDVALDATTIEAPIKISAEDIWPLQSSLSLFPVFTRGLDALALRVDAQASTRVWRPDRVHETPSGLRMEFSAQFAGVEGVSGCLCLTRERDQRRLVLAIALDDDALPVRFPSDVPSLWVTAPTDVCWDIGVLIGGPFEIDVGRSELATERSENADIARELGDMLREGMEALEAPDANPVAEVLASGVQSGELWHRVFAVLAGGGAPELLAGESARAAVFRTMHLHARGLSHLCRARLPTGLPDGWSCLTTAPAVSWFVGPRSRLPLLRAVVDLARDADIEHLPVPGAVVSDDQHQTLAALDFKRDARGERRKRFDVEELLRMIDASNRPMSLVLAGPLVRLLRNSEVVPEDREYLRDWMRRVALPAIQGRKQADNLLPPASLRDGTSLERLVPDRSRHADLEDQARRAAFAPPGSVLSEEWLTADGMTFFLGARGQLMVGNTVQMAQWTHYIQPDDRPRQHAVLAYVLDGNLQLADELVRERPTWLPAARPLEPLEEPFVPFASRYTELVGKLYPITREEVSILRSSARPQVVQVADANSKLQQILDAHRTGGARRLSMHDEQTFGRQLDLVLEPETAHQRESWLALFTRASLLRWGWGGRNGVQHRGFMERAWQQRWFRTFSERDANMALSHVLCSYQDELRGDAEFSHWLSALFFTHYFGRHLDDFVDRFAVLDRRACREDWKAANLRAALDARLNLDESGGGYDLPPLTILRHGVAFVVRELRREPRRLLKHPSWDYLAWPATARLRRFAELLGGPAGLEGRAPVEASIAIQQWIKRELGDRDRTLDCAYDLPVLWFSSSVGLDISENDWGNDE